MHYLNDSVEIAKTLFFN